MIPSMRRRVRSLELATHSGSEPTLTDFLRAAEKRRATMTREELRALQAPWSVEKARSVLAEPDTTDGAVAAALQQARWNRARRVLREAACPAS